MYQQTVGMLAHSAAKAEADEDRESSGPPGEFRHRRSHAKHAKEVRRTMVWRVSGIKHAQSWLHSLDLQQPVLGGFSEYVRQPAQAGLRFQLGFQESNVAAFESLKAKVVKMRDLLQKKDEITRWIIT